MATRPNFGERTAAGSQGRVFRLAPPQRDGRLNAAVQGALEQCTMHVQDFPLFVGASPDERSTILTEARVRSFSRGQTIYFEGDELRQVMLLTSGSAKMIRSNEDGAVVILRLCGPGELLGTLGKSLQGKFHCTAQALTPCVAVAWDGEAFERLSNRFSFLRLNVAHMLYKLLQEMEDRFREISTECVACRLSRQVLRLADQVGTHSNGAAHIQINREELAQLVGTTLFTVSRLLSKWGRQGIVITRREGFSVANEISLKKLIGECELHRSS